MCDISAIQTKRNRRRLSTRRTRGKEVDGNSPTINLHPAESKFCQNYPCKRSLQQKESEFLKKPRHCNQEVILHHINHHQTRQPQPYSRKSYNLNFRGSYSKSVMLLCLELGRIKMLLV